MIFTSQFEEKESEKYNVLQERLCAVTRRTGAEW